MLYLNDDCYIEMNPIPENYSGTLTFGKLRDVSLNDDMLIYIYKLPLKKPLIKEAQVSADGVISFQFSEEEFFTKESAFILKFYKKDDHKIKLVRDPDNDSDTTLDKEAILLRFINPTVETAIPYDYTLEKFNLCKNC